ncbi:NADPH-dependent 2,4-dienoyl-CoA reductase/sulfur reductase-like enzyme [Microbacterium keratanolyticum]|nr:FAD-dependent oxidoreductase [Microbacterium keratanolyticum]MBM7469009.1 NADPH-dependent 2,4-dienoyl-CoA reductase/sulfur reductase-like enzyme [Microbacterium keratanolyticum]
MEHILIVGAGIAAVTAADALRRAGHTGRITVVGDEPHAPYSRPPLSKGVLKKTETLDSVTLPALPADVELLRGTPAVALDRDARTVRLADGQSLPYDGLVIATGARARTLRADGAGETVLRGIDDALALEARWAHARSVLVIGGGFLGMEVASTARHLGLDVTVIDLVPHLVRQFGTYLTERMTAAAEASGVSLVVAPEGIELIGDDVVQGVRTVGGATRAADVVVSAVGDLPNVEWLASAGLADPRGLLVDSRCRIAPDIVAIGDVARTGERRTPHWGAAIDQARVAAVALLHGDEAAEYVPAPYFWTEQWGLDLKICGEIPIDVEPEVIAGSWHENSLLLQYSVDGVPVAAASVNRRFPITKLRALAQPALVAS